MDGNRRTVVGVCIHVFVIPPTEYLIENSNRWADSSHAFARGEKVTFSVFFTQLSSLFPILRMSKVVCLNYVTERGQPKGQSIAQRCLFYSMDTKAR